MIEPLYLIVSNRCVRFEKGTPIEQAIKDAQFLSKFLGFSVRLGTINSETKITEEQLYG